MFGFFSDFSIVVLIYFKTKLIVFVLQFCFDFYKKRPTTTTTTMFDLHFFNVVSKIMTWSVITPPTYFVNTHEFKIEKRTNKQSSRNFMDSLKIMSPEFIQLHAYVQSTYPFYFGLGCQEGFLQPKDSHTIYACN